LKLRIFRSIIWMLSLISYKLLFRHITTFIVNAIQTGTLEVYPYLRYANKKGVVSFNC